MVRERDFLSLSQLLSLFFFGVLATTYCRKLFKGHLRNKLSFYYNLDERDHKAKCTPCNKYITRVYTSFFQPRNDLRWTQKHAKRSSLATYIFTAEKNCSKRLTKSSAGTNENSNPILEKETTHQECACTSDNKRTTSVYLLFFTPKCKLHWTIKQGQYTIPIRDFLIDRRPTVRYFLSYTS